MNKWAKTKERNDGCEPERMCKKCWSDQIKGKNSKYISKRSLRCISPESGIINTWAGKVLSVSQWWNVPSPRLSFFPATEQYGSDDVLRRIWCNLFEVKICRSFNSFQLERLWSACLFLVICQHPLIYRSTKHKTWGFQWISSASSFPRKGPWLQHRQALTPAVSRQCFPWQHGSDVMRRDKWIQYRFHSRKLDFGNRDGSCSIRCVSQPTEGSGFSLRWPWLVEWVRDEDLWECVFNPLGTLFLGINNEKKKQQRKITPGAHVIVLQSNDSRKKKKVF